MKTLRLFIASVFLMQGTLCPSLCWDGFMSAPAEDAPCHEMLDSGVVTGGSAGQLLAGNTNGSAEESGKADSGDSKLDIPNQKINEPNKSSGDEPTNEKKSKSSCCGDEEALLAQSSVWSDGLAFDGFELPLLVFLPSVYNTLSTRDPPVPLVADPHRSSPDLRILYSSFLI